VPRDEAVMAALEDGPGQVRRNGKRRGLDAGTHLARGVVHTLIPQLRPGTHSQAPISQARSPALKARPLR